MAKLYPVQGAATAFFKGKFWVFGGSTGDDSYDDTVTDKVHPCRIPRKSNKIVGRKFLHSIQVYALVH